MIFADSRYNRHDKRSKLPPWILKFLSDAQVGTTMTEKKKKLKPRHAYFKIASRFVRLS